MKDREGKSQGNRFREIIINNRRDMPRPQLLGLFVVTISMCTLFLRPESTYFIFGVALSIPVMILVTYYLTGFRGLFRGKNLLSILVGLFSAAILYFVFYAGNYLISIIGSYVGIRTSAEASIYSTIGAHPLYSQLIILVLDAVGFESYFRGNLQNYFSRRIKSGRFKISAPFLSALIDAAIHVVSLNPLWVITTFIADSVWGLTYYYNRDLSSNIVSHFVWDVAIFIIAPIG